MKLAEPTGALARIANPSCQADPFALGLFEVRFQRVGRKWGFEKENQVQSVAG